MIVFRWSVLLIYGAVISERDNQTYAYSFWLARITSPVTIAGGNDQTHGYAFVELQNTRLSL